MNTAETGEPTGALGNGPDYAEEATSGAYYPGVTASLTGNNQSVNNIEPYLTINYIIALQGTFPSRS